MNILSDFQFLRPHFLWFVLLLAALPFILKQSVCFSNVWEKVCDKVLLEYLMASKETSLQKKFNFWIYLGFLSASIALAGPSFRQTIKPMALKETPLMIVLDLSSDMNRIENSISRLSRAKIEMTDILKKSKAAPSGLIVYTYEPFLISPLAYDSDIITNLLPAVGADIMPLDGNKVDRAIDLAVSKLQSNNYKEGNILLFTSDIPLDFDKALASAQNALKSGYKVSVYGLASKTNEKLERLAQNGGGICINTSYASSSPLIKLLKNTQAEDYTENKNTVSVPEDDGFFFVIISVFCVLRLFLSGLFVFAALFLLPVDSYAGFFYNQNQEGALLFSSREYNKAADRFKNTDWKAAAYYKAGDYDAALKILQNKNDVTSLYNKGNALAKSGKISKAIKTYEEVLKQDPNHEDAKFNLEYLKKLAKQQQSPQSNKQNNQNQENQNENNQQNQNQNQNADKQDKQNPDQNGEANTQSEESPDENDKPSNKNEQEQNQPQQDDSNQENQNQAQNQNNNQNDKDADFQNNDQNDQEDQSNKEQSNNKKQNQTPKPDEKENQKPDEQSDKNQNQHNDLQSNISQQQTQAPVLPAKEQQAPEYDETVQVREQRFRAIKENPGGLLKAFIREEYLKKRYEN